MGDDHPLGLSDPERGGRRLRRSVCLVASLVTAATLFAGGAWGRLAELPLEVRLGRALAAKGISPEATGAVAVDLESGAVVLARNAAKPLQPASTEKLTVALAALDELGSSFRIETVLLGEGRRDGVFWRGHLVLKGFGDPSLHRNDLAALVRRVRALGIRRVTGRVLGDESFFDRRRTAPGWKPSFYKIESPPLSALVVDRARLNGRTVDEPALAAAVKLRRALERGGVDVVGRAALGTAEEAAVELGRIWSPPLRRLVVSMNADSDNFVAETILKELGARELHRGTTAAGARVVRRVLAERNVPLPGVRIVDGSGLSRLNRLTARALVALLLSARRDVAFGGVFVGSLAVAGVSGTLKDRMEKGPARGRVRAKTGTTSTSSALAGYVGRAYVFAILMNGHPVPYWYARRAQDRFAQILARAA